ncbi:MAG: hypothetical protein RR229_05730 [Oscillospiraceae bacterium]
MIRINEIKLPLDADESELKSLAAKALKINKEHIINLEISKKSIDSRRKNEIKFIYSVDVSLDFEEENAISRINDNRISIVEKYEYVLPEVKRKSTRRPVIIGFGPAGMFAALTLCSAGLRPIIIERGQMVDERNESIKNFWQNRVLNVNSNVQFGEGGAGTFSDGKLTTGIKDNRCRKVFLEFCENGAPNEILYSSKPHIGTDKLGGVVKNIRKKVIANGGEFRFETTLTNIIVYNSFIQGITVTDKNGNTEDIETDSLILSIGHSARDTIEMLNKRGAIMMQKPFSVGVRIEHPQEMINKTQYGRFASNKKLGSADYKLACHPQNGRGAYTFCMCPGGTVVCASSEENTVVVNGMSEYARDKENANSAVLVGIEPENFGGDHPLAGMYYQREIEQNAFKAGGSNYSAPAQLVGDFLKGETSKKLGMVHPSCPTGVEMTNLHNLLPKKVTETMLDALVEMNRKLNGFTLYDAVLTAPETRSSSPVRIVRDEFYQSNIRGLYPCGEGAGYAGGIVSAGVDGIKCAEAILKDEG